MAERDRVDVERLAYAYRHRSYDPVEQRIAPILEGVPLAEGDVIVDVGGGRGVHAAALSAASEATAVVIDPSRSMVRESRTRGLVGVVGRGEQLPLRPGTAALVLFHLSIHHGDWRRMLIEAWRVARPGGVVWVWTMPLEHVASSYLGRWFPRVAEIDGARFPDPADVAASLRQLGGVAHETSDVVHVTRPAAEWVQAVRDGFVSTLHLLTDEEIEEGLERFETAHPEPDATISYDLLFTGVWSARPSVES